MHIMYSLLITFDEEDKNRKKEVRTTIRGKWFTLTVQKVYFTNDIVFLIFEAFVRFSIVA